MSTESRSTAPVETVTDESGNTVKIYNAPKTIRGTRYNYYEVRGFGNRLSAPTLDKAHTKAKALLLAHKNTIEVPLDKWEEWVEFQNWMGKSDLSLEGIRAHYDAQKAKITKQIDDLVLEFLEKGQFKPSTLSTYKTRLGKFRAFCSNRDIHHLHSFTLSHAHHLLEIEKDPVTRANQRRLMLSFFSWARKNQYLPDGLTVFERTMQIKTVPKDPEFFTVEEVRKILCTMKAKQMVIQPLYVLMTAFMGMRRSEAINALKNGTALDLFKSIQRGERPKLFWLGVETTKTASRRSVMVTDQVIEWVRSLPSIQYPSKQDGLGPNIADLVTRTAKGVGVPWKHNGFRKAFISHGVRKWEPEELAQYSGHSSSILKRVYMGFTTPEESEAYFNILPSSCEG